MTPGGRKYGVERCVRRLRCLFFLRPAHARQLTPPSLRRYGMVTAKADKKISFNVAKSGKTMVVKFHGDTLNLPLDPASELSGVFSGKAKKLKKKAKK